MRPYILVRFRLKYKGESNYVLKAGFTAMYPKIENNNLNLYFDSFERHDKKEIAYIQVILAKYHIEESGKRSLSSIEKRPFIKSGKNFILFGSKIKEYGGTD